MAHQFFLKEVSQQERDLYIRHLQAITLLSRLFSGSQKPYLHYRVHERIFCKVFKAIDLSRSDIAIDCGKGEFGIGLKTFVDSSRQKIAEFNKQAQALNGLNPNAIIQHVAKWRNDRLDFARKLKSDSPYTQLIYHYVYRQSGKILIFEEDMSEIDLSAIEILTGNFVNIINFKDKNTGNSYSFNKSKNTLYHDFDIKSHLHEAEISIHEDPFQLILQLLKDAEFSGNIESQARSIVAKSSDILEFIPEQDAEEILLPLYAIKNGEKYVYPKSGLNQWNAKGRSRHEWEVYVPIPSLIHKNFPDFFPTRDDIFTLILPSGEKLSAKICQDGGKALMSNPNSSLGKWLLKDLLKKQDGELVTYGDFERVGIDSIALCKLSNGDYKLDFKEIDSYENFKKEFF
ncbi:MAG: NgoFVII family restriction endonuclease [Akkermansia sp.]